MQLTAVCRATRERKLKHSFKRWALNIVHLALQRLKVDNDLFALKIPRNLVNTIKGIFIFLFSIHICIYFSKPLSRFWSD